MTHADKIQKAFEQLNTKSTPALRQRILSDATQAMEQTISVPARKQDAWRLIMKAKTTRFAAAAIILMAAVVGLTVFNGSQAYALEQTVAAFENIRCLHVIRNDASGAIEDERWIEINPDGSQGRYRQDTRGKLLVVDDGHTRFVFDREKNTVLLYGMDSEGYTWIYNVHDFFRDMAGDNSVVIEENADFNGKPAHLVRWHKLNVECYIDPATRLPIAIGRDEILYDTPPADIFTIPDPPATASVYDKRPGAEPSEEPAWLKDEQNAQELFDLGRKALADQDYPKAIIFFKKVFELEGIGRNWAWFWLGQAYAQTRQHSAAVDSYTQVIDMLARFNWTPHYAFLARGLSSRALADEKAAWDDFKIALPVMIDALTHIESCKMFDYADDPLNKGKNLSEQQRFDAMVRRLTIIAGNNPSADARTRQEIITAWENWWSEISAH